MARKKASWDAGLAAQDARPASGRLAGHLRDICRPALAGLPKKSDPPNCRPFTAHLPPIYRLALTRLVILVPEKSEQFFHVDFRRSDEAARERSDIRQL